jgi:hypothetical protein
MANTEKVQESLKRLSEQNIDAFVKTESFNEEVEEVQFTR